MVVESIKEDWHVCKVVIKQILVIRVFLNFRLEGLEHVEFIFRDIDYVFYCVAIFVADSFVQWAKLLKMDPLTDVECKTFDQINVVKNLI